MRMGALVLALALVVMASAVMAADVSISGTPSDKGAYTDSNTGASTSVTAGHVHEVNINLQEGSNEWAGIFGNITGTITLGDGTSTFFEWPLSTLPSYIYITYHSDINWASVAATSAANFSTILGTEISWTANNEPVDQTFTGSADCGTGTTTIAAYVYGDYNGDATISAEWPVCAFEAKDTTGSNDRAVYAAAVTNNGQAYDGSTADYEAIVAASTSGTTVYFYKLG